MVVHLARLSSSRSLLYVCIVSSDVHLDITMAIKRVCENFSPCYKGEESRESILQVGEKGKKERISSYVTVRAHSDRQTLLLPTYTFVGKIGVHISYFF